MAKSASPVIIRLTLQAEFGQDTMTRIYQSFCKAGTVEDRQSSGRPLTITEEKVDEVRDVCESELNSSIQTVATACSIPRTTAHRTMNEYLSLKPCKAQFAQEIYEEDMQDRMEICRTLIPILRDSNIQPRSNDTVHHTTLIVDAKMRTVTPLK